MVKGKWEGSTGIGKYHLDGKFVSFADCRDGPGTSQERATLRITPANRRGTGSGATATTTRMPHAASCGNY